MKVYEELKIIAEDNRKRAGLIESLGEKIDLEGYDLCRANLFTGCTEKDGRLFDAAGKRLDNSGLINNEYYLYQRTGYLEDDFYGTVFYATNEPGSFIAIPFCL